MWGALVTIYVSVQPKYKKKKSFLSMCYKQSINIDTLMLSEITGWGNNDTHNFSKANNPKKDPFLRSWILLLLKILQRKKKVWTQSNRYWLTQKTA